MLYRCILFMIHVISYDICYYALHVMLHNRSFYFLHKKHHKTLHTRLTYMDAFAGELIEFPLQTIGVCIPFWIEKDVVVLIGSFVFVIVRSCLHHDNRFIWFVGNHHILHHTYPNYNYGEWWIDALCGTKYNNIIP